MLEESEGKGEARSYKNVQLFFFEGRMEKEYPSISKLVIHYEISN